MEELYKCAFPATAKFVSKKGGSFDDATDIFQEALVIYLEKSKTSDFVIKVSPAAYLLGISKHLWYRKFRHQLKNETLDELENISIPEEPSPNTSKLLKLLEHTGKKCLDLLRAFYFEKESVTKIGNRLGYQNAHSASVQKYKCIEKIRNTIKDKALNYEDFLE